MKINPALNEDDFEKAVAVAVVVVVVVVVAMVPVAPVMSSGGVKQRVNRLPAIPPQFRFTRRLWLATGRALDVWAVGYDARKTRGVQPTQPL